MPWEILHSKISREKFEPEPGFEPRTSGFLAQVVERRARNPEFRGSNPGSGSNFSLEILQCKSTCYPVLKPIKISGRLSGWLLKPILYIVSNYYYYYYYYY